MTRGVQAQRKLQTTLTLAHRECGQFDRRIDSSENTGQSGIPGRKGGNNTKPATDIKPGQAGSSGRVACKPPNRQCQESKGQEAKNGNKSTVQPERPHKH